MVGSEMSGGVKDIRVSNCTFLGTDVGLRFKSTRGRGGVVENIHIENIRMIDIATDAVIFNLFYQGMAPTEKGDQGNEAVQEIPEVTEETPEFRNITLKDISCVGAEKAVNIIGLPEMPVNNIRIENSVFSSIQGINCYCAKDLALDKVRVLTAGHPTLSILNVSGMEASDVSGNDQILLRMRGSRTSDILIRTDDVAKTGVMVLRGEEINPEELMIEEL